MGGVECVYLPRSNSSEILSEDYSSNALRPSQPPRTNTIIFLELISIASLVTLVVTSILAGLGLVGGQVMGGAVMGFGTSMSLSASISTNLEKRDDAPSLRDVAHMIAVINCLGLLTFTGYIPARILSATILIPVGVLAYHAINKE